MRSLNTGTRALLFAAVAIGLLAGVGCAGPSIRELQYPMLVDQNKKLESRKFSLMETIIELDKEIVHLRDKLKSADSALTNQTQEEQDNEKHKLALLERLKKAIEGTPSEAERRGDTYVVVTRFSFEPGKAALSGKAEADLQKIARALADGFPGADLLIAGHADKSPIRESKFASNWHLSGERARSVMEFFVTKCKVAPEKIAYAGFGEFRPVADNMSPAGREKNRRVEIIVNP